MRQWFEPGVFDSLSLKNRLDDLDTAEEAERASLVAARDAARADLSPVSPLFGGEVFVSAHPVFKSRESVEEWLGTSARHDERAVFLTLGVKS